MGQEKIKKFSHACQKAIRFIENRFFSQLNNKQAHFQSKLLKIEQNNLVAKCKGGFRCWRMLARGGVNNDFDKNGDLMMP